MLMALQALSTALANEGATSRVVVELPMREFTMLADEARQLCRLYDRTSPGHPLLPIIVEGTPQIRVVLATADRERLLDFAVPKV